MLETITSVTLAVPAMLNYGDDPLWDGAGCGPNSDCCDFNDPPWFRKQLPSTTTDNIEMRLCRAGAPDEDTPVEIIEIYVQ